MRSWTGVRVLLPVLLGAQALCLTSCSSPRPPRPQQAMAKESLNDTIGVWRHRLPPDLQGQEAVATLVVFDDGRTELYEPEYCNLQLVGNDYHLLHGRWRDGGDGKTLVVPMTYGDVEYALSSGQLTPLHPEYWLVPKPSGQTASYAMVSHTDWLAGGGADGSKPPRDWEAQDAPVWDRVRGATTHAPSSPPLHVTRR